ncbi:hypothetical protein HK098_003350 [Nowakowskiella sp. JEL0407]|nr:hypothetical protein HK098_003350 [Nowakowskiella sp. JEL0407]
MSLSSSMNILTVTASFLAIASSGLVLRWLIVASRTPTSNKKLKQAKESGKFGNYNDIPGPVGYPIVGIYPWASPYMKRKRMDLYISEQNENYGGICRIDAGGIEMVFIDDAAMAKKLLNSSDYGRGKLLQKTTTDFAPFALFVIPSGDQWKKHRKGLQPAFGPSHLREAFTVSLETVDQLLDLWESKISAGNNTRNVMEDFTMLTADIIAKVAFSLDLGGVKSLESNKVLDFHHYMERIAEVIELRSGMSTVEYLWGLLGVSTQQIRPATSYLRGMLQRIISDKIATIKQKQNEGIDVSDDKFGRDLLDRLVTLNDFSEEEIMSEVFGFFLAGHETTANTLTFALLELAQNQRVFLKLKEEIDTTLKGQKPTNEIVSSLKYLDAFFKETQRIYSVVVNLSRESLKDTTLTSSDGLTIAIPANTQFVINIAAIHTSKVYWGEDAEEFKPERWLDSFTPVPGSYLPFGDGQMSCIGQKMAIIETKVALIRIIERFTLKISPNQGKLEPIATLTFGLKNGLLIDISKI